MEFAINILEEQKVLIVSDMEFAEDLEFKQLEKDLKEVNDALLILYSVGRSLPTDEEIISEIELHEQIDTKTEHSGNVKLWIDMYKLGFKKAQTIDVER